MAFDGLQVFLAQDTLGIEVEHNLSPSLFVEESLTLFELVRRHDCRFEGDWGQRRILS